MDVVGKEAMHGFVLFLTIMVRKEIQKFRTYLGQS